MPNLSWQDDSKCVGIPDPDIFFPPRDKELYKEIASQAKAICFGKDGRPACPVRIQCLIYADDIDAEHGIFGGLSPRERSALKRKASRNGMTLEEWVKSGRK